MFELAQKGSLEMALCIWIDLNSCIFDEHILSSIQRQVIVSHYLEGKSLEEIAIELEITSKNTSKHLNKGIDNIRKNLNGESFDKWGIAELDFLKKHINVPDKELACYLNRSIKAIQKKKEVIRKLN